MTRTCTGLESKHFAARNLVYNLRDLLFVFMKTRRTFVCNKEESMNYLVKPQSTAVKNTASGKGVLVLHAWWGLNDFFKGLCNRLGQEGFTVLAPDLYDGAIASTIAEAGKLSSKLKRAVVMQKIPQAVKELQAACGGEAAPIGVIGFSLGGYWALWLAQQKEMPVAATVIFYATRGGDYTTSNSAFQFHFAEIDEYTSASGIKTQQKLLKAAGREAEFYTYPGTTHWFFENDRPQAYNPQAAELAFARTIEFLRKQL
jgi:carboxymethylenebutenolidase